MTSHTESSDLLSHAKYSVQFKSRFDKTEDRTLILTSYCFHVQFVQGTPPRTIIKTEFTVPFLDIAGLENVKSDEILFSLHDQRRLTYVTTAANALSIIIHIMTNMTHHFPEIKIEDRLIHLTVHDQERLQTIRNNLEQRRLRIEGSPCGSFRDAYDYFCKYFNTPKRDEIVWDIERVYHTQNSKTLILRDFDHVDNKDLLPLIAAVAFSNWFVALDATGVRLNVEAQTQVLQVLKKNKQLEGLILENTALKNEFCSKMPGCIDTTACALRRLSLSHNAIGDAGVSALSGLLMKLRCSLHDLMLASCGITARGANRVAESFAGSIRDLQATLTHLDLSGNSLKGEELSQFYNFLANQNALQVLDLTKTDCSIDTMSASLSRGCTQHLRILRLSGNPFLPNRRATSVSVTWRQFFESTISLEEIHLSGCRLPVDALRLLLLGLSTNRWVGGIVLNISSNELRSAGATDLLVSYLGKLTKVSALDISDNDFNYDMLKIIDALMNNGHIKHLKIGANYNGLKTRQIIEIMEKLVRLLESTTCNIESLSMADSKLKGDITILLNDLSCNTTLTHLDISGNAIGDVGLRILSRVLVLNTHLRDLVWDRNNISLQSLEEMAKALDHNHTLQYLRTPGIDIIPLMQRNPDKTIALLGKIQETLAKNHGLRKVSTDRAFKLHQGLMSTSTTHQLIDKLIVQLDGRSSRLESADAELLSEEAHAAIAQSRVVIADAQAAKRLLASMQAGVQSLEDDRDTLISRRLTEVIAQLHKSMDEQASSDIQTMLNLAKSSCQFVQENEVFCDELRTECVAKAALAPRFLDKLVSHTLTTGLFNKMAETNLTVAAHMSDRVLDETVKHLDECHRRVSRHVSNLVTLRRRHKQKTESVSSLTSVMDEPEDAVAELREIKERDSNSVPKRTCRPRSTFAVLDVSDSEDEKVDKPSRSSEPPVPVSASDVEPTPRTRSMIGRRSELFETSSTTPLEDSFKKSSKTPSLEKDLQKQKEENLPVASKEAHSVKMEEKIENNESETVEDKNLEKEEKTAEKEEKAPEEKEKTPEKEENTPEKEEKTSEKEEKAPEKEEETPEKEEETPEKEEETPEKEEKTPDREMKTTEKEEMSPESKKGKDSRKEEKEEKVVDKLEEKPLDELEEKASKEPLQTVKVKESEEAAPISDKPSVKPNEVALTTQKKEDVDKKEKKRKKKKSEEVNGKAGEVTPTLASPTTSHSGVSAASRSLDSLDSLDALSPFPDGANASPTSRPLTHLAKSRPRRQRQHRPTKATVGSVDSSDDLFSPTPGYDLVVDDDEGDTTASKPPVSPVREKRAVSVKESSETANDKKSRSSSSSGFRNLLKKFPGTSKTSKSGGDSPKASRKLSKEGLQEQSSEKAEPSQPNEPAPQEDSPVTSPPRTEDPPLPRGVPRGRGGPIMPGLNLAELQRKREEIAKGGASQVSGNGADEASSAKTATPGRPDSPGSSPRPKPSYQLPPLKKPVTLREKDQKSAAQLDEDKEKRLSVRDRKALLETNAATAAPPPPPPKPKRPSRLGERPTSHEKPQD